MSKRILVVEDRPDNRRSLAICWPPTDYEITEAENGEDRHVLSPFGDICQCLAYVRR